MLSVMMLFTRATGLTPPITRKARLDITIGDAPPRPLTIGLFGTAAPQSVAVFEGLCSGSLGDGLTYTGSSVSRIQRNKLIMGGSLAGGNAQVLDRTLDRTGYVRSERLNRADAYLNDDANDLSHDRAGLLSVPKGGGSFEFVLTPAANPELDATRIVIGTANLDDGSLELISELNDLPARKPSAASEMGGVASLYGLRLGLGFGLAGLVGQGLQLTRRDALAVTALGTGAASFIGSDPREQPDLSYRPLVKVRIVSSKVLSDP